MISYSWHLKAEITGEPCSLSVASKCTHYVILQQDLLLKLYKILHPLQQSWQFYQSHCEVMSDEQPITQLSSAV